MDKILEVIECSESSDTERFVVMLEEGIANSELTLLNNFKKSTTKQAHERRLKKAEKEHNKASKKAKAKKGGKKPQDDVDSLSLLIQQKSQDRKRKMDDILESMEKKALKGHHEKVEEQGDLPTDDEFNKLQEKLMKRQSKKQKQGKA
jgi:DnaJ family protein C protein 9